MRVFVFRAFIYVLFLFSPVKKKTSEEKIATHTKIITNMYFVLWFLFKTYSLRSVIENKKTKGFACVINIEI